MIAATVVSQIKRPIKILVDRLIRAGIPRIGAQTLRTLPHDREAFTQGLTYHEGFLYESIGSDTRSSLRCLDPNDGRILHEVFIEGDHAEGIAAAGDQLVQLSWKSGRARVYHLPDIEEIGTFAYEGEGWGLTAGPAGFIMSDGSSTLCFLDHGFNVVRLLHVRSHGIPLRNINDIERVGGSIYANILGSTDVFEISLDDGTVIRTMDCSALAVAANPGTEVSVLNGIAYNRDRHTLFLTGKHWPLLFEVRLPGNQ